MADKFEGQFPNYFSNVTRSVKYSAKEVSKEVLPSAASFLETNDDVLRIAVDSLKNMPKALKELKDATAKLPGVKQVREATGNFKSDLKTGNFHNRDRISANEGDMGTGMGFDPADMADMFGDSVSVSMDSAVNRAQSSFAQVQSQSTTAITSSMDTGFSVTSSVISSGNAQNLKASEENLNAVNKIVSFNNESIKPFVDKSLQFYDDQITESRKIVALLQEDVEHKRNMYKQTAMRQSEGNYEKIFDAEGFLDIKAYSQVVKQNMKDAFGAATGVDADFLKMMLGGTEGGKSKFITSPISALMEEGMKKLIPTAMEETSKALDETLKNFSSALIAKINSIESDESDYTGDSKIGQINHALKKGLSKVFKVNPQAAMIDTKTYHKGPVPWDGIARKSLIEVIPSLLSKINTGIHGLSEDLVYDYESGNFTTGTRLSNDFNKRDRFNAVEAMSGLDGVFEKYVQTSEMAKDEIESLRLGLDDLKFVLAKNGGKYQNTDNFWEELSETMSNPAYGGHDGAMMTDLRKMLNADNKQAQSHIGMGQVKYINEYNSMIRNKNLTAQTSGLSMSESLDQMGTMFMNPDELREYQNKYANENKVQKLKDKLSIANSRKIKSADEIENIEADIKKHSRLNTKKMSTTSLLYDIKRILLEGIITYNGGMPGKAKGKRKFSLSQSKLIGEREQELEKTQEKILERENDYNKQRRQAIAESNEKAGESSVHHIGLEDALTERSDKINQNTKKSVDQDGSFLNRLVAKPMAKITQGMDKINNSLKDFLFGTGDENNPTVIEKGIKWLGVKWDKMVKGLTDFFENEDSWLNRTKKKAQDWFTDKVTDRLKTWWSKEDGAKSKLYDFLKGSPEKPGMLMSLQNWGRSFSMGATNFVFGNNSAYLGGDGKIKFNLRNAVHKNGVIGETFDALSKMGANIREALFGGKAKFGKDGKLTDFSLNREFFPSAAKGAGLGLLASMFIPGGPLLGMLVGGVAGYAKRSGALGDFLFGKEGEDGKRIFGIHFNKGMRKEFKDNRGGFNTGMGAGIGVLASIFLPGGPLLGAAIGGFMGLVKSSKTLRDQLFGEESKFAKVFGKDFKDKFGQRLPSIKAGIGIGAISSLFLPGGPLLGALMGGMVGLVKDSKGFQRLLWGDKLQSRGILGGSIDFIKSKFLLPITKVFAKSGGKFSTFLQKRIVNRATFVMDVMLSDVKHYTKKLYSKTMGFFFDRTKGVVTSTLGKLFSPFLKAGKAVLGGAVKGLGKVISSPFAGAEAMAERRLKKISNRDSAEAERIAMRRAKMDEMTDKSDTALQKVFGSMEKYATEEQERLKKQKEEFRQYHNVRISVEKEINKLTQKELKLHVEYQRAKEEEINLIKERNKELRKYKGDKQGQALVHSYHNEKMQEVKKKQRNIEGEVKFNVANEMGKDFLENDKDPMKFTRHGTKAKFYTFNKNTVMDMEAGGSDAGHAILEGIIKGMEDARDQVDDSVELQANSTIEKFREEFGINSPAKEMIPIGEGIIEGILVGMENKLQSLYGFVSDKVVEPMKEKLSFSVAGATPTKSHSSSDTDNGHDGKMGESYQDTVVEKEKANQANALNNMAKHSEETARNTRGLSLLKMGKKGFNALKAILFGAIPFLAKVVKFGKGVIGFGKKLWGVFKGAKKVAGKIARFGKTVLGVVPKALKFGKTVIQLLRALPAAIAAKGLVGGIKDTFGRKGKKGKGSTANQAKANKAANKAYKDMTPEERKAHRDDRLSRGETIQQQNERLQREAAGGKKGFLGKAGKFGKMALNGAKGIPVAGQVLAAGLAGVDGFMGWKDAAANFGLEEGEKANFGQKLSSATGSILSGLSFGILDEAKMAQGIHGLGGKAKDLGGKALDWGGDAAKSMWEGGKALVSSTKEFVGDAAAKVADVTKGVIEFRDKVGSEIRDRLSDAKDIVTETADKMKDTVASAWKGAKDLAGSIGDKISSGLSKATGKVKDGAEKIGNFFGFGGTEMQVTSGFGKRISPFTGKEVFHPGTDIAMEKGSAVRPITGSAKVVKVGSDATLGNYVELLDSKGISSKYAHLDAVKVKEGQTVDRNNDLGTVGLTGKTTGPHLHFEAKKDGKYINSDNLIKQTSSEKMGGSELKLSQGKGSGVAVIEDLSSSTAASLVNMLSNITQMAEKISEAIPSTVESSISMLEQSSGQTTSSSGVIATSSRMKSTNRSFTSKIKTKFKSGVSKLKKFFGFGGTELGVGGPAEGATMSDTGGGGTATNQFALPVKVGEGANRITSKFGPRPNPFGKGPTEFHKGIDYAPHDRKAGQPVMSIADGTVSTSKFINGYGNVIYVDHDNGIQSRYAHLLDGGLLVKSGDRVSKGQIIGKMGSTGRSTGNHLHFEIRKNKEAIDPESFLSSNGATAMEGTAGNTATDSVAGAAIDNSNPLAAFLSETGNLLNAAIFGKTYVPGGALSSGDTSGGGSSSGGDLKSNGPIVGALARKYETGNRGPGMVSSGKGDHGGISYGSYQIPSYSTSPTSSGGQLPKFVDFLAKKDPDMAAKLKAAYPVNSENFKNVWKTLGETQSEKFANIQHEYQELGNYATARNKWKSNLGLDIDSKSVALQAAGFSTSIQHGGGGASKVFKNAGINNNMDAKTAIERIYAERAKVGTYFPSSPSLHGGLRKRFQNEKADALAMYAQYGDKATGGTEIGVGGPAEPIKFSSIYAKKQKEQVQQAELIKPALDTNIESITNEMDTVMSASSISSKTGSGISFERILQVLNGIYSNTKAILTDGIDVKNIAEAKPDPIESNSNQSAPVQAKPNKPSKSKASKSNENIFLGTQQNNSEVNTDFMRKISEIASGKM